MTDWKFTDARLAVVMRTLRDGVIESCAADREDVLRWVAEGNTILEPDPPPPPSKDEVDAAAALQNQRLRALLGMSPAEIEAWFAANVTNLAQARDAMTTLAIGLSAVGRYLLRRV